MAAQQRERHSKRAANHSQILCKKKNALLVHLELVRHPVAGDPAGGRPHDAEAAAPGVVAAVGGQQLRVSL